MGTYDGVGHGAVSSQVGQRNAAEQPHAVGIELRTVHYSGILEHALLETDATQKATLLALGGMILKVLAEVALVTRLGNSVAHTRQLDALQLMQFGHEFVVAFL